MKAQALQIREIIKWDNWSEGNGGNQGGQQGGGGTYDDEGEMENTPSHPGDNEQREGAGSSRQGDGDRDRQNPEQQYQGQTRSGHEPHRDAEGDTNEPRNNT